MMPVISSIDGDKDDDGFESEDAWLFNAAFEAAFVIVAVVVGFGTMGFSPSGAVK
jgi:hypothetical protein